MLAVVVPAHNEETHIGACLASLREACAHPALEGELVLLVAALDACTDRTADVCCSFGAAVVETGARNVGVARALGASFAMTAGARWLAFTDADSVVAPDWLVAQLAQRTDAVCGTVEIRDWLDFGEAVQMRHRQTYHDADGHRHVHGANLGVSARAYRGAGGFRPLQSSEDVALVEALQLNGASIAWSAAPRVVTSARRTYRAPGGLGETLVRAERMLAIREIRPHGDRLAGGAGASGTRSDEWD